MKKRALVFGILILRVIDGQAQTTNLPNTNLPPVKIEVLDATNHYRQNVVVTAKIAQVSVRPSLVFLNLEKEFPNSPLTAVVFSKFTNQFGNLTNLAHKTVEITGVMKEYHGKPEIVLENTNQLKILADGASTNH